MAINRQNAIKEAILEMPHVIYTFFIMSKCKNAVVFVMETVVREHSKKVHEHEVS